MLNPTQLPKTKTFSTMKAIYLLLAIAGTIAPWFWLVQNPVALQSPSLFLQLTFANNISTTWATDLIISACVFFAFAWMELQRLRCSRSWFWLYVGLTFGVGLCCSLPLFLYQREHVLTTESRDRP